MAVKVAFLLVSVAVMCLFLRASRPEIALMVALCAGAIAFMMSMDEIRVVAEALKTAMKKTQIEGEDAMTVMKAAGIAIAGEYGAQLCRDAGEGALAQRVDMAVRISLMALSVPVILRTLDAVLALGA